MNNPAFLILFLLSFFYHPLQGTSLYESDSSSLLSLKEHFENKVTNVHSEKVYIHTDRNLYLTGETIWMSFYCVDAAFHYPSSISKVLNVELLNNSGKSIKKLIVQLKNGIGNSQFLVSPDLVTGSYIIRGFTNWMKNFDPDFVFQNKLTVLNPAVAPASENQVNLEDKIELNFFPEGGDLVVNKESKVAVKATDHFGKGIPVSGSIIDSDSIKVTGFVTSERGYASFQLTPKKEIYYFAEITDRPESFNMPKAKENGLVLSVSRNDMSDYKISLSGTEAFHEVLYLVVHTRGIIVRLKQLDANDKRQLILPSSDLMPGISHITILDKHFNPLVERLIFKYPEELTYAEIALDKEVYAKREKVALRIDPVNIENGDALSKLSLSVTKNDINGHGENNIVSNLLLTSDIKGRIEEPWRYFDPKNEFRSEQIDLVMLTNGWRKFTWNSVLNDTNPEFKYPAEFQAPMLSGQILTNQMDKPPNRVFVNIPGKSSLLNSTSIDSAGFFHFEMPFRIDSKKVYFFTKDDTLKSAQIKLQSPFDLGINTNYKDQIAFSVNSRKYLEGLNLNIQLSEIYKESTKIDGLIYKPDAYNGQFYGKPDHEYLLDDYTRFETIEDLFIEYIRKVRLKHVENDIGFYMINEDGMLPQRALTMIDGVPIDNMNFILNYDPLKIEKIELANNIYYVGGMYYYGIINFISYEESNSDHEITAHLVEKLYYALQQPRTFYSPVHAEQSTEFNRIPDFRNTLYWDPDVKFNANEGKTIEFYSSDDVGSYQIEINGITKKGKAIYDQYTFQVR